MISWWAMLRGAGLIVLTWLHGLIVQQTHAVDPRPLGPPLFREFHAWYCIMISWWAMLRGAGLIVLTWLHGLIVQQTHAVDPRPLGPPLFREFHAWYCYDLMVSYAERSRPYCFNMVTRVDSATNSCCWSTTPRPSTLPWVSCVVLYYDLMVSYAERSRPYCFNMVTRVDSATNSCCWSTTPRPSTLPWVSCVVLLWSHGELCWEEQALLF